MVDVKKLITGFLVLAALASSSALIFSGFTSNPAPANKAPGGENPAAKVPTNAFVFVEEIPRGSPSNYLSINDDQQNLAQDNLTANFAVNFANQVLTHNPEGPAVDESGKPSTLNLPDEMALSQIIADTAASTKLDVISKPPRSKTTVIENYSDNDIKKYLAAAQDALQKIASSTEPKISIAEEPTPEKIIPIQRSLSRAAENIAQLQVPKPLATFHRNLLDLVSNQEGGFAITANNYDSDPLKVIIALQKSNEVLERDVKNFKSELEKIYSLGSIQPKDNWLLSLVKNVFGIKKINAAIPVSVIHDTSPTSFSKLANLIKKNVEDLKKWIYKTLLRRLVAQLINQLQNQVVSWIQGGGKPLFITNWKSFLAGTANQAVGATIEKIVPGLCNLSGPLIQMQLRQLYAPRSDLLTTCTLDRVISNIKNFNNDFRNGGWVAYAESIKPNNDVFTRLYLAQLQVDDEAEAAKEAAKNEGTASQGFLSVKTCPKGTNRTSFGWCEGGLNPKTGRPNISEPINITPGSAVGHSLFGSLNWKKDQIVTAERLEELVGAIVDASINRIIKQGLIGISGLGGGGDGGGGGGVGDGGATDIANLKSSMTNLATDYRNQYQQIASSYTGWLGLQQTVVDLLGQVSSSCPSLSISAQARAGELISLTNTVRNEATAAQTSIAQLNNIIGQIAGVDDITTLNSINNVLTTQFDINAISDSATTAQNRNSNLVELQGNAQANLPPNTPTCSIQLNPPQR